MKHNRLDERMAKLRPRRGPPYTVQVRSAKGGGLEKRCTKCRLWVPLDSGHFYENPKGAFGFFNHCIACERARKAELMRLTRPDLFALTPEQRIAKRRANLLRGTRRVA